MYNTEKFHHIAEQIIAAGKFLYQSGWSPATSSNYSMRYNDELVAITVSGKHKGQLTRDDIMLVDLQGNAFETSYKSSAETLLHTSLYAYDKNINAVLHTHSVAATVLSRTHRDQQLVLSDYEMQKVFSGITTHEGEMHVPLFDNTQNMTALSSDVIHYFKTKNIATPAYLIRGHGLYAWGATMQETLRHVEGLEFLLQCELATRSLRA